MMLANWVADSFWLKCLGGKSWQVVFCFGVNFLPRILARDGNSEVGSRHPPPPTHSMSARPEIGIEDDQKTTSCAKDHILYSCRVPFEAKQGVVMSVSYGVCGCNPNPLVKPT